MAPAAAAAGAIGATGATGATGNPGAGGGMPAPLPMPMSGVGAALIGREASPLAMLAGMAGGGGFANWGGSC